MTKYVVTDANGKKHTRNSHRVYTHAVLYRDSKEHDLKWANTRPKYYIENFWHHHAFIDGSSKWLERNPWETDDVKYQQRVQDEVERSKRALRGCKTAAELWELQRAEAVAAVEAKDYSIWHVAGFRSRRQLAEKLALNCRAAQAIILPVEVVG
jgi:hypothetical protein